MVTLTIDGIEVTVERGASILEAAQKAGVRVPTLCYDKRLVPYGACRLCMVEVKARGRTRTMPACFNPARDGMEVTTQSPRLTENRRMELMLLLRSHPLLCPSCDAGGNCRFQELVHEYEVPELPFPTESRHFHVDHASHFIRFNMNLCIKCGMCVRICDEVQGVNELSFVGRGMHCEVSTDFGRPLDCEFCGQCAQVCPVGAIASKWLVGTGRDFELKKTDTVCAFCSLGCVIQPGEKDGKVVWVTSPPDSHNDGNLCVKGRYGWPYVFSPERLTSPLIRKNGVLTQVDWNEALTYVAEQFNRIKNASGSESLAALGSERLTNEEAYVFGRFVRTVLGTPHLDHEGGYGYRGLVDGLMPSLGYPASPNSIKELKGADVIVLLGADLYETHPVAKNDVIVAASRREAKLIVIDSMRTKLAEKARINIFVSPGCEHLVAYAMLKEIINSGLVDRAALDLRAEGFDELIASLAPYSADKVAALTGVDAQLIRQAAQEYAQAARAMIVVVDGMNQLGRNVLCAQAAAGLALVTGRIGKDHAGVCMFGEKTNAQGAIDMGLAPDLLPGHVKVADDAARAKFEAAWQSPIPVGPGMNGGQIVAAAAEGTIRGLYVVGENPLETYPDRALLEKALAKLEFLVVQDMFLTSTAKAAHAVLPVASFMEKTGTFTSAERRIQRLIPIVKQRVGKSDLEVFSALAAVMGKPAMTYAGPRQVMDEIAGLVAPYGGVSYDRIGPDGICWPCVDAEDTGRKVLYEGGFPGGKAKLLPAPALPNPAGDGLPMYLIVGALKFHSGSFSEWSPSLMEVSPEAIAEMNLADMDSLGLDEGDTVRITGSSGARIEVKVKPSRRPLPGTVIVPQHFSAVQLNRLTSWNTPAVKVKVDKV
ncbi:MAG: molybdopterin-dependent oxidoreductase [Desulfomonile sp.]|nr:molybdopterin-dependent oxidoreductase [Desulfomonile sp.]